MVRLNLSREPQWFTLLDGVRVCVSPITSPVMAAARAELPDEFKETASSDDIAIAFYKAVARRTIVEWDGVEDDKGKPAKVTDEAIDALLDVYLIYEAWVEKVMAPSIGLVEELEAEKNGSALSPSGTSAGVTNTARPAKARAKSARPASTRRKR